MSGMAERYAKKYSILWKRAVVLFARGGSNIDDMEQSKTYQKHTGTHQLGSASEM